ncbi:MAG: NAD(P)/FAD-dependent oxidoreductase [Lewinellaceae bacterium]|nr:NAD(P)/FAD-dependent oxidoreductase [Lewinellaceae bacterium]
MKIVILGNGISGITAARHIRKRSDCDITVISDETDHFYSRTALMYIYMGHMRFRDTQPYEPWFWEKNRIELMRARIERIDFGKKTLFTTSGDQIGYDKLLLATGSRSNKFGWPGQNLDGVQGLYHYQDIETMERHSKGLQRAVIVGGGLIGVEMAEMFHSRGISVTFLVRESDFWNPVLPPEEAAMVSRHLREHHIDLRLETELKEILPDKTGKKCAAVVTGQGERIDCGFVGLTVGVSPNVDFLKGNGLELNRGILVDEYLQTNIPDVYAAGDCAEQRNPLPGRRAIEAVWYTGRMMGETAAHNMLADNPAPHPPSTVHRTPSTVHRKPSTVSRLPYTPGIWFNSAKFFDIEYQVYGDIRPALPDEQQSLYWEHSDGKKGIRINYDAATGRVLGFNLMGVRYRHEVCEKWLREGAHVEAVLSRLGMANFDPEFSRQYEAELVDLYNRQTGKNIQLKQKRGLDAVLSFLSNANR